jgi:hypothetical protein
VAVEDQLSEGKKQKTADGFGIFKIQLAWVKNKKGSK